MRPQHPPRGAAWSGPQISRRLMRDFFRIDVTKEFLQDEGGITKETQRVVSTIKATLLPLNNEDLQRLPDGTSTVNTQKMYTNGETLDPGQLVQDSLDGQIYAVITELTHTPIHEMKRYVVTKKGAAANGR